MTSEKVERLISFLETTCTYADSQRVSELILLITLMAEVFAPYWLELLHTQNMARAKFGRHSEEARAASDVLKKKLQQYSILLRDGYLQTDELKKEFVECNKANAWTTTHPTEKAREELHELVVALNTRPWHDEKVLDSLLDIVYAAAEVKGVHC